LTTFTARGLQKVAISTTADSDDYTSKLLILTIINSITIILFRFVNNNLATYCKKTALKVVILLTASQGDRCRILEVCAKLPMIFETNFGKDYV